MPLISKNPYTEEVLTTFEELSNEELDTKLALGEQTFVQWRTTTISERTTLLKKAANLFRERAPELGRLAALEMGKPITQGIAEAQKCAVTCEYYAEQAAHMLEPEHIASDASESFVRFDPIGTILAVMPWNFPFWQVVRFAAPTLVAGNVGLLKHATNVPQCALALEAIFLDAGFPIGVFQNLAISSAKVERVIRHHSVQGISLTGSEQAGSAVASLAGSLIKKTVLELGGSDPFIVLEDADIDEAATVAAKARLQNNGQSCIAAKRFIVMDNVYEEFLSKFITHISAAIIGDPLDPATTIGPMVNEAAITTLEQQISASVARGATVACGGKRLERQGYFFAPTVITEVTPGMPAYNEELFGPVASVIRVPNEEEAIRVANDTVLGLGASMWTKDNERAKKIAPRIRAGAIFVNGMVKSDPRLPFGGTGVSGYGRELSAYGLKEFVNVKTVWVR